MIGNQKYFFEWIKLKKNLHEKKRMPTFNEGEVWWCAVGENIGVEVNGKNGPFSRPVLIFKKMNKYSFLGVPFSTKSHIGSWYTSIILKGKSETVLLSQIRVMSVSRLYERLGTVSRGDYEKIKKALLKLYF